MLIADSFLFFRIIIRQQRNRVYKSLYWLRTLNSKVERTYSFALVEYAQCGLTVKFQRTVLHFYNRLGSAEYAVF
jgi:hypothetical protein